jgi:hypothetical protein
MHANNYSGAVVYIAQKVTEIFPEALDLDMCGDIQRKWNVLEMESDQGRGCRSAQN